MNAFSAKLISALETEGLKGKVVVMIGGAPVAKEDADRLGAFYDKTREDAVALAKKAIGKNRTDLRIQIIVIANS